MNPNPNPYPNPNPNPYPNPDPNPYHTPNFRRDELNMMMHVMDAERQRALAEAEQVRQEAD